MTFSKKTIGFAILLLLPLLLMAQTRQTREEYIARYKSIAVAHMERYGIPASITLAQGVLESDAGNSWLSKESNNHFGIKCKKNWQGATVFYDDDAKGECFRSYPSVEASYQDHADFLDMQPRYDSLFAYSATDYKRWARGLKAAGYATAPDYAARLVKIVEESKLYLLDQPNGEQLYAEAMGGTAASNWFESQSSVGTAEASAEEVVDPDRFRVTINAHNGYKVYRTNNVCYLLAKRDDTYENIAKNFRVSARNLRKFNDVGPNAQPVTGEVVYIERKKSRWEGNAMIHVVKEGETFYSLAQSYGIRQKSLARINRMRNGFVLTQGTTIKIR
ncbi:MAG: glucosaminidase domain-containing protein [Alistipes sp.]